MPNIHINVTDKIALASGIPDIVCGNNDYTAVFTFDSEWNEYEAKTARFVFLHNGAPAYTDVLFTGDTVQIPALYDTPEVMIGVYAGDIHTTTPARIPCIPCITDGAPVHCDPTSDVYNQLMKYLAQIAAGMGGAIAGNTVMKRLGAVTAISGAFTIKEDET